MGIELRSIISQLSKDKGVAREVIISAVESAMLSAARKHFGHGRNLESQYNEATGEVEILEFKTVVEEVTDPLTEISLEEARQLYDPEAQIGDELGKKLDTKELGRIAAQTAKQVILQKVRDAERGVIYEEFKGRRGEIVNGIVQRYERNGSLIVNLGRTDAVLPRKEQIARERYRRGDRIRAMILDVDPTNRGSQVILSRSHPDFLRKLFELEVPEIADGTIEIKGVAREAGERAKIAVHSNDSSIDPVGACVGVKGSRVQAVVSELRGERIDIIVWSPDAPSYVARALSPAEVTRVVVDEDNKAMEVIVLDKDLSIAIGRRGQNVKLASKLTGWRIDVRSESMADKEAKAARAQLELIPDIDITQVEMLYQAGYRSLREVAEADPAEIAEVENITEEEAGKIVEGARFVLESKKDEVVANPEASVTDLDQLAITPTTREKLIKGGLGTIQKVVLADDETLRTICNITDNEMEEVKQATESFLKSGYKKD